MEEIFRFIFKYFAFIAVGVNFLNYLMARKRFAKPEILIFFIAFNSIFLAMGILQLLGGYATFFYIFLPPSRDFLILFFWIYYFVFAGLITLWILFGNGAEILLECGFVRGINNPVGIKIFFPFFLMALIAILFVGHQFGFFEEMVREVETILN